MCGLRPPQDLLEVFFHYAINNYKVGADLPSAQEFSQVLSSDFVQDPFQLTSVLLIQENTQTLNYKCMKVIQLKNKLSIKSKWE